MEKDEKENQTEVIKKIYSKFDKKYSLPDFHEMNNEFGIEKADSDSEFPLKEIIKVVADKFQNYMRFLEGIINPSNSSLFAFSLVKLIDNGKRAKLAEVYTEISKIEIKLIKLDLNSTEEFEAEFLKESYETWKKIKKDIYEVINFVEENWNAKKEETKKDYFG
jgi:hypothetical protein